MGTGATAPASEIIGGTDATGQEDFAKSVAALYNTAEGSWCSASILSDTVLVTAAHCVDGKATDLVAIFNVDARDAKLIVRRAQKTVVSEKWAANQDRDVDTGDIALVKFAGGLPPGYQPAKLLQDASALKDGADAILAGYGINDGAKHVGGQRLRFVATQIKNAAFAPTEIELDQTGGKGACHGDSGGPAYIRVDGELLLFGVTSRGIDDPNNDCSRYSAFTLIPAYLKWIEKTMQALEASDEAVASAA
jgi:secreted trypsin-like serine protease